MHSLLALVHAWEWCWHFCFIHFCEISCLIEFFKVVLGFQCRINWSGDISESRLESFVDLLWLIASLIATSWLPARSWPAAHRFPRTSKRTIMTSSKPVLFPAGRGHDAPFREITRRLAKHAYLSRSQLSLFKHFLQSFLLRHRLDLVIIINHWLSLYQFLGHHQVNPCHFLKLVSPSLTVKAANLVIQTWQLHERCSRAPVLRCIAACSLAITEAWEVLLSISNFCDAFCQAVVFIDECNLLI